MRSPYMAERPHVAQVGDQVSWALLPGVGMEVLAVRPCTVTLDCPEPHAAYEVRDFTGAVDWLCAYSVHKIKEGPSR